MLDTSGSMSGQPIAELNEGLRVLKNELMKDELAQLRVELSIITFGPVKVAQDFISVAQFNPPTLVADDVTPMGGAINRALDLLDERKGVYKVNGISYFRPWIFLITDGGPTDGAVWEQARLRLQAADRDKKIAFFAVGVEGANMDLLNQLSSRQALRLQGLNFREMFVWLSSSLSAVSASIPGEDVPLQSPMGWGAV
nr:hypothetical protein [Phormidium sp. FACHB-1136]